VVDNITLIGTIAATCTTIAFLPQVIKTHRTRHVRDLSLPMYVIFTFGVMLWFAYGIMTDSMPIIAANLITFVLCLYILYLKLKYND
jgi:MtN3 and saliva related transmembrane protein